MSGSSPTPEGSTPSMTEKHPKPTKISGLQLAKPKAPTQLIKHVPFSIPVHETKGSKWNSNKIHATGSLKANACLPCLIAMSEISLDNTVGRGSRSSVEYFCCMVSPGLGVGGLQCGRCIGLGKGVNCTDVPVDVLTEARSIVALASKYNKVLSGAGTTPIKDLPAADLQVVKDMLAAGEAFASRVAGLRRQGLVVETPQKKRKINLSNTSGHLLDFGKSVDRGQFTIEAKVDSLTTIVKQQAALINGMAQTLKVLNQRSVVSRGRDRYLVDTVHDLAVQGNHLATHLNSLVLDSDPIPIVQENEFDLAAMDLGTDCESSSEDE